MDTKQDPLGYGQRRVKAFLDQFECLPQSSPIDRRGTWELAVPAFLFAVLKEVLFSNIKSNEAPIRLIVFLSSGCQRSLSRPSLTTIIPQIQPLEPLKLRNAVRSLAFERVVRDNL